MARRRIGQETLGFDGEHAGRGSNLEQLHALIAWQIIECHLAGIYNAAKGEPAWPPLALFKALLLAVWYGLSDVKLAEALDDRASFRRFCGFSAHEPVPGRTGFVRFRKELAARGLDRVLFEVVTRQLKAKAVTVKTGTLVDAAIIASSSESDGEARWVKHKNRKAVHGFKAHPRSGPGTSVGADADTAIVEELAVTPGNVNDGRAGGMALPDNPGEVYADSAYRGPAFAGAVKAKGGPARGAAAGMRGRDEQEALATLKSWNDVIQRVRCRIEKIFGTWKRSYGLRRMRWKGLAKATLQVRLTAIAYNMKRTANILAAA
jgi:transposase, IS5 family